MKRLCAGLMLFLLGALVVGFGSPPVAQAQETGQSGPTGTVICGTIDGLPPRLGDYG